MFKSLEEGLRSYFSQQSDIEFSILFGSQASGRTNPMSDVDVGVYFSEDVDGSKMGDRQTDLTCDLMKILKKNRIDVVILNLANPFLKFQVFKYGKPIYIRDERKYYSFKARCFGEYQDIKPMYDFYNRKAAERLKRGV